MGFTRREFSVAVAGLFLTVRNALSFQTPETVEPGDFGFLPTAIINDINFFIYDMDDRVHPLRLKINHIKEENIVHPNGFAFQATVATMHPLLITYDIHVAGLSLWEKSGREIQKKRFSSSYKLLPGDNLNVTYTCACHDIPLKPIPEDPYFGYTKRVGLDFNHDGTLTRRLYLQDHPNIRRKIGESVGAEFPADRQWSFHRSVPRPEEV